MDLHKNFVTDVSVHKEELIKFWESSTSASGSRNCLKDSSTLQDRAFYYTIWLISPHTTVQILMKILSQLHHWTLKTLLNFGSDPDTDTDSGSRPHSRWWTYAVFDIALLGEC